jgi:hypothetical protein
MRTVSSDELRSALRYALGQLPKSILRDMQLDRLKRDVALTLAADRLAEAFRDLDVRSPHPPPPDIRKR